MGEKGQDAMDMADASAGGGILATGATTTTEPPAATVPYEPGQPPAATDEAAPVKPSVGSDRAWSTAELPAGAPAEAESPAPPASTATPATEAGEESVSAPGVGPTSDAEADGGLLGEDFAIDPTSHGATVQRDGPEPPPRPPGTPQRHAWVYLDPDGMVLTGRYFDIASPGKQVFTASEIPKGDYMFRDADAANAWFKAEMEASAPTVVPPPSIDLGPSDTDIDEVIV